MCTYVYVYTHCDNILYLLHDIILGQGHRGAPRRLRPHQARCGERGPVLCGDYIIIYFITLCYIML